MSSRTQFHIQAMRQVDLHRVAIATPYSPEAVRASMPFRCKRAARAAIRPGTAVRRAQDLDKLGFGAPFVRVAFHHGVQARPSLIRECALAVLFPPCRGAPSFTGDQGRLALLPWDEL